MIPQEFYAFVHTVSLPGMLLPHWPSPPTFPLASAVNLLRVWSSLTLGPGRGLHTTHHVCLRVILSPHCNVNSWREQQSLTHLHVHRAQQRPVTELASVNACWMNGGGRECLRRNSGPTRARQFQQQNYTCKHWVRKAFPFASATFSPVTGRNSWNLQLNLPTMRYVGDVCWSGTGDRSRTVTGASPRDQREWKWQIRSRESEMWGVTSERGQEVCHGRTWPYGRTPGTWWFAHLHSRPTLLTLSVSHSLY